MHLRTLNFPKIRFLLPVEISGGNKFLICGLDFQKFRDFYLGDLLPPEISAANTFDFFLWKVQDEEMHFAPSTVRMATLALMWVPLKSRFFEVPKIRMQTSKEPTGAPEIAFGAVALC